MRWFVDISSLSKSDSEPERQCVEATQWQEAIRGVRRAAGLDDGLRNFSIEVLDQGVRAVDPISRLRYMIVKAPDERPPPPAASSAPAEPKKPTEPPKSNKPFAQTMAYGSPGSAILSETVKLVQDSAKEPKPASAQAVLRPDPLSKPVTEPPRPISSAPASAKPAAEPPPSAPASSRAYTTLVRRAEEPSDSSPLSYREYAYAIATGSTEEEAEAFLFERFEEIKKSLSDARPGKLVNLAVFDHAFKGKPRRPPIATLVWKDWRGKAEIRFPARPGASIPAPSLAGGSVPPSSPPERVQQPPSAPAPPANQPTLPSSPAAMRHNPGNLGPEQSTLRSAPDDPVPPPIQPAQPLPVQRVQQDKRVQPNAPEPEESEHLLSHIISRPEPRRTALITLSGEEIIADVFEAMHDLYFLRDAFEGADFVNALATDRIRCPLGIAQLYDINRREFVVAHAIGPNSAKALGNRTDEYEPLLVEIMSRRVPFVIDGTNDLRIKEGRWKNLGGEPNQILACSVQQGGRFLGILEVAHTEANRLFTKAETDGLAYIASSFAEFVAGKGLTFGSGQV